jgi:RNA polymerase sigma-70 factor, ECF subfamily
VEAAHCVNRASLDRGMLRAAGCEILGSSLLGRGLGLPQELQQLDTRSTVAGSDATALFKGHSPAIFRYCLKRLGSREEAEDAVQQTFLNAWRSLERGFEPQQPRSWLFQIAANVCSSSLRSKLGTARTEPRDPVALDDLAAHERAGHDELVGLPEALRLLPMKQRRALLLRDWQGLSYREIATDLAVSVASVETLLFRGRKKVATTLATTNWRKVTPSMRGILLAPFALMRTKSLSLGGGEHVKVALMLAGGTVAPLVAFGVIQGMLWGGPATSDAARSEPVAEVATAHASVGRPDDASPSRRVAPALVNEDRANELPPPQTQQGEGTKANGGKTTLPPDETQPETPPESPPSAPPSAPPSSPSSGAAPKVEVCIATGSASNPGVGVDISEHGLKGVPVASPAACE